VANERLQLEALITEQQVSILTATSTYEQVPSSDSLLLMEADSSQSLVAARREETSSPTALYRYQDRNIASSDKSSSDLSHWLSNIHNSISSHIERLLDTWTCLPQLEARLREAEQQTQAQQRESQQPMVESDDEEDYEQRQRLAGAGTRMTQPLFSSVSGCVTSNITP
jgi:septal ring factor EnvC (AmiA/AmiB activator)